MAEVIKTEFRDKNGVVLNDGDRVKAKTQWCPGFASFEGNIFVHHDEVYIEVELCPAYNRNFKVKDCFDIEFLKRQEK